MAGKSVTKKAKDAREAALALSTLTTAKKNRALREMANAIRAGKKQILDANARDVREAEKLVRRGELSKALLKRLALDPQKVEEMAGGIEAVARLEDPVGKTLAATEMADGLTLYRVACPIGVIGAVFESRPDAVPQIASLCLKSGNAVIMKGGSEAAASNRALVKILSQATASAGAPETAIQIIETREEIKEILALDEYIDLLVPRGSNAFIKFIQDNTKIPVLGHADGICHEYVDADADLDLALKICLDAKTQYPAVCNAMETLLVHRKIASRFLPAMVAALQKAGVEVRGCPATRKLAPGVKPASEADWTTEYLDLILSVRVVDDIEAAIAHINRYGSGHTDGIVARGAKAARRFMEAVDSACVFHNASTRFSDGFRFGLGAEVGISTNKTHARGPVGLEGLVIYKYLMFGEGHTVAEFAGTKGKRYTHKTINAKTFPLGSI